LIYDKGVFLVQKRIIYLFSFLAIAILGFFVTYHIFLSNEEQEAAEENNEMVDVLENDNDEALDLPAIGEMTPIEPLAENINGPVTVDTVQEERITPSTKLVIQSLYSKDNRLVEEEMIPPYYFLDLTRDQIENYTKDYMESPQESDIFKEIMSFELISFSSSKVVLRKVFNTEYDGYYQIYLDESQNKLIIENSDGSIREDIDVQVKLLSEEEKRVLEKPGRKVYSEEELLLLIESYSS
jgi:hypothetical protein